MLRLGSEGSANGPRGRHASRFGQSSPHPRGRGRSFRRGLDSSRSSESWGPGSGVSARAIRPPTPPPAAVLLPRSRCARGPREAKPRRGPPVVPPPQLSERGRSVAAHQDRAALGAAARPGLVHHQREPRPVFPRLRRLHDLAPLRFTGPAGAATDVGGARAADTCHWLTTTAPSSRLRPDRSTATRLWPQRRPPSRWGPSALRRSRARGK